MMPPDPPTGFFGKLPTRGDFLRVGLPRSFTDPLDDWLRGALAASRSFFGERWEAVWEAAPIWRFALPPGACGPDPAIGVMLASRDSVGRTFPLVLARLAPASDPMAAAFMAAAERAGRTAITAALEPVAVQAMLRLPAEHPSDLPAAMTTQGWTALPAPSDLAAMLEPASETP
jgi:type VI secretion system protein ImpM